MLKRDFHSYCTGCDCAAEQKLSISVLLLLTLKTNQSNTVLFSVSWGRAPVFCEGPSSTQCCLVGPRCLSQMQPESVPQRRGVPTTPS